MAVQVIQWLASAPKTHSQISECICDRICSDVLLDSILAEVAISTWMLDALSFVSFLFLCLFTSVVLLVVVFPA